MTITTAFATDSYPFNTPQQTQRFERLTHSFRCLVCQNQSLADSDALLAADLRSRIYQMIKDGKSDSVIKYYLVKRYGEFILLRPPFNMYTALLWLLPFILLLLGFIILYRLYCVQR